MEITHKNPKPAVVWLEGILDYFNMPFPHEPEDPREIGFGIGRQIVGLYLSEMILNACPGQLESAVWSEP